MYACYKFIFYSHLALVIILTRAGLDVDPSALRRLTIPVLKLSLVPFTVEACSMMILSRYFLDLSWMYGLLLGKVLSHQFGYAILI